MIVFPVVLGALIVAGLLGAGFIALARGSLMGLWGLAMIVFPVVLGALIVAGLLGAGFIALALVLIFEGLVWFATRNTHNPDR
jgi:hypothetical protein